MRLFDVDTEIMFVLSNFIFNPTKNKEMWHQVILLSLVLLLSLDEAIPQKFSLLDVHILFQ